MKTVHLLAAAAVAAISAMSVPAFAANAIVNGDFSTPNTGGGWENSQGPLVTGWTDVNEAGGNVEIGNSSIYGLTCISTNCQNLEVNNNTFGDVFQTVTGLTAGQSYTVSFDYGGRTSGGPDSMNFLVNGTQLGATIGGSIGSWTPYAFTFTAPNSGSATVEFQALVTSGLPSYGNEITNVSLLSAVPEPATWAMMMIGLGGLGVAMRSRRRMTAATA